MCLKLGGEKGECPACNSASSVENMAETFSRTQGYRKGSDELHRLVEGFTEGVTAERLRVSQISQEISIKMSVLLTIPEGGKITGLTKTFDMDGKECLALKVRYSAPWARTMLLSIEDGRYVGDDI